MAISPSGATVWRDFVTDGVPVSGANKPAKAAVRAWSTAVEQRLEAVATASAVFDTRAALYAVLTYAANTMAWVVADSTAAYNGIYKKNGASGSGSWSRLGDLPYSFVKMTDAGAGTANAIQVTSTIPTSDSVLRISNVYEANTGNVTISENGGTAKSLLTNSGNQISSGGLTAGMMIAYFDNGTSFRLLNDQVSAAIVAAAEAAAATATTKAAEAAAAVAVATNVSGPGGRLSLIAGVALPESDVSSATSIKYIPTFSALCPVYDGSGYVVKLIPDGLELALTSNAAHAGYHQSGKNFDVWAYDGGSGNIAIGTGPAWSTDTTRGTGTGTTELEAFNGLIVNKNAITLRFGSASGNTVAIAARRATYLGSFRATANGVATDTELQRLLFNHYNRDDRKISTGTSNASYAYSAATWRAMENNPALRIEILLGTTGVLVSATATATALDSAGGVDVARTRIGVDSTSVPSADCIGGNATCTDAVLAMTRCDYRGYPGLGFHYLAQLEYSSSAGNGKTMTWFPIVGTDMFNGTSGSLAI